LCAALYAGSALVLFEHFWILCGLWVGAGSVLYGKFRSGKLIENGMFSVHEVNRHLVTFLACIFVPCFLFWLIQQSGAGISNPAFTEWPSPQRQIAISLLIFCWFSLAVWVFFLNGAVSMAKTLVLISTVPESFLNPSVVKVFVALTLVVGVTSLILQSI
jgi:hypothetical protein